jgi:hypothetical protein
MGGYLRRFCKILHVIQHSPHYTSPKTNIVVENATFLPHLAV